MKRGVIIAIIIFIIILFFSLAGAAAYYFFVLKKGNGGTPNPGSPNTNNNPNAGTTNVPPPVIPDGVPAPVIPDGVYRIKSKFSVDTCDAAKYLRWRYCGHTAKHQTTVSAFEENTTKWIFNLVEGNDIYTIRTSRGPQDGCYIYLGATGKLVEQPQKYKVTNINSAYHIMNVQSGSYLNVEVACSSFATIFGSNLDTSLWYLDPV